MDLLAGRPFSTALRTGYAVEFGRPRQFRALPRHLPLTLEQTTGVLKSVARLRPLRRFVAPVGQAKPAAREGWKFLVGSIGENWGTLAASFAAALVWTGCVVSVPELLGHAVDAGILGHDCTRFVVLTLLIAVVAVVQARASGVRRWTNGLASRRLEAELRQRFFSKFLTLEVAYHDAGQPWPAALPGHQRPVPASRLSSPRARSGARTS